MVRVIAEIQLDLNSMLALKFKSVDGEKLHCQTSMTRVKVWFAKTATFPSMLRTYDALE